MTHEPKEFTLKGLKGISDDQISQHKDILYAGYVKKLNEIEEKLKGVDTVSANQIYSELRALKIEESFALNGMVLHELYFENLGNIQEPPGGKLAKMIARDFGDIEMWTAEFKACGMAARGWVLLSYSYVDSKLHNYCLDSHNTNFPARSTPLLVMDVYEHAYAIDYGVKRPPYIDAFMENIKWSIVEERFAVHSGLCSE
jgi:Fe-Mn family superoxide dismutase